jgi:hypothetical protein
MSKVALNSGHSSYTSRASRFKLDIGGKSIACVLVEAAGIELQNEKAKASSRVAPVVAPTTLCWF